MKPPLFIFRASFILASIFFISSSASAGSVYGTATEIDDGDTVTIVCLKRPLKVRLMAIDAPDKDQPYGDVARQHLSHLILNRFVAIKYSGLGSHGLIVGRVFLNEMDVGAQMIRDGVAWFDRNYESNLTENERHVYAASELAARSEKRGLWQDNDPVSPWVFRQGLLAHRTTNERAKTARASSPSRRGETRSLTNDDLVKFLAGSGNVSLSPGTPTSTGEWKLLAPDGEQFSAVVPDGLEYSNTVPARDGKTADINGFVSIHEGMWFIVVWMRGPNENYTDFRATEEVSNGLVRGLNRGLQGRGHNVNIELSLRQELRLKGYFGRYYELGGGLPGVIRSFTRQIGKQRVFYLFGVINGAEGNASVDKFLNSFEINTK